jgi:hypothetical protein
MRNEPDKSLQVIAAQSPTPPGYPAAEPGRTRQSHTAIRLASFRTTAPKPEPPPRPAGHPNPGTPPMGLASFRTVRTIPSPGDRIGFVLYPEPQTPRNTRPEFDLPLRRPLQWKFLSRFAFSEAGPRVVRGSYYPRDYNFETCSGAAAVFIVLRRGFQSPDAPLQTAKRTYRWPHHQSRYVQ